MPTPLIRSRSRGKHNAILIDYKHILTPNTTPTRSLIKPIHNKSGRNNQGKITIRHHGGKEKRMYRERLLLNVIY